MIELSDNSGCWSMPQGRLFQIRVFWISLNPNKSGARGLSALVPFGPRRGSEPGVSEALREIGQNPARVVEAAKSDEIAERYKGATEEAKSLGVFVLDAIVPPKHFAIDDERGRAERFGAIDKSAT